MQAGKGGYWSDSVAVRASALQSIDLGFISLDKSYLKTLKYGIYGFPACRTARKGQCGEQAGKFACCVLGQGTQRVVSIFSWKTRVSK